MLVQKYKGECVKYKLLRCESISAHISTHHDVQCECYLDDNVCTPISYSIYGTPSKLLRFKTCKCGLEIKILTISNAGNLWTDSNAAFFPPLVARRDTAGRRRRGRGERNVDNICDDTKDGPRACVFIELTCLF